MGDGNGMRQKKKKKMLVAEDGLVVVNADGL